VIVTIGATALFSLLHAGNDDVPVLVEMSYTVRDPYAVGLRFHSNRVVEWFVARELLAAGLTGPAGDGDVHVRPVPGRAERVLMELRTPDACARLSGCATTLGDFLHQSFLLVAAGSEPRWLDLDALVARLLDDTGLIGDTP